MSGTVARTVAVRVTTEGVEESRRKLEQLGTDVKSSISPPCASHNNVPRARTINRCTNGIP